MNESDKFAFLLPLMMLTLAATFAVAARWHSRAAAFWAGGYAFAGLAYLVPMVLEPVPLVAQALLADAGFLLAFWCFGQALLDYFDRPRRRGLGALVVALGFAGAVHTVVVMGSMRAETVVNDVACSVLLLIPLAVSGRHVRHPIDWGLLGVTLLVVTDNLVRTVLFNFVFASSTALGAFTGSPYAFAMQLTGSVLGLVFALVALAAIVIRVVEGYRDAAERDALTGLLNRRGFERATGGFQIASGNPASLVVCDLDHFKRVNDAFGHAAGDRVLAGFADTLRVAMPPGAVAARFGGEEFVLFLPGVPQVAAVVSEVLRIAFAERDWRLEGIDRGLTASFGVAETRAGDRSPFEAIARADVELYAAKRAGRNRVMIAPSPAGHPDKRPVALSVAA